MGRSARASVARNVTVGQVKESDGQKGIADRARASGDRKRIADRGRKVAVLTVRHAKVLGVPKARRAKRAALSSESASSSGGSTLSRGNCGNCAAEADHSRLHLAGRWANLQDRAAEADGHRWRVSAQGIVASAAAKGSAVKGNAVTRSEVICGDRHLEKGLEADSAVANSARKVLDRIADSIAAQVLVLPDGAGRVLADQDSAGQNSVADSAPALAHHEAGPIAMTPTMMTATTVASGGKTVTTMMTTIRSSDRF